MESNDIISKAMRSVNAPVSVTLKRWQWETIDRLVMAEAERKRRTAQRAKWQTTSNTNMRSAMALAEIAGSIADQVSLAKDKSDV